MGVAADAAGPVHQAPTVMNQEIATFLNESAVMLTTAKTDAEVQAVLAPYGYTPAKIDQGLALLTTLEDEAQDQVEAYADQYAATEDFKAAWEAAKAVYKRHLELTRILFEDDTERAVGFMLRGRRERDVAGWLFQARKLYDGLAGDAAAVIALGTLSVTPAQLNAANALVDEVEAKQTTQQEETGEAQAQTKARDSVYVAARKWIETFRRVAIVACTPFPQLREKLGLLEPS